MIRVGVTGGIGSGKSTLCRLLEERGVPIYYSDARAHAIMNGEAADGGVGAAAVREGSAGSGADARDSADYDAVTGDFEGGGTTCGSGSGFGADSGDVRRRIIALLGEGAYRGSRLDSAYVAGKVFADKQLLASLDAIVHPAVALDFEAWARAHADSPYVVLESAVLVESGFDRFVDRVVNVSARPEVRVDRVVARGGVERGDVLRRMANQLTDSEREARAWLTIRNDGGMDELTAHAADLDGLLREIAEQPAAEHSPEHAAARGCERVTNSRAESGDTERNNLTDK